MRTGVYMIELVNTPFVYIGESKNVDKRWKQHDKMWVWPNDAKYTLVREMQGSEQLERLRTEEALSRLLKRKGKILLSVTRSARRDLMVRARKAQTAEHRSSAWSSYTPEMRKARLAKAHSTMKYRARAMAVKSVAVRLAKRNMEAAI